MNKLNKKAVSAVVATVLIIMITVAAVGIIWAAIIPMVKDSLSEGTLCSEANNDVTIGIGVTCRGFVCNSSGYSSYNSTHCNNTTTNFELKIPAIKLQIKKDSNANVKLTGVQAVITTADGNSDSVEIRANASSWSTIRDAALPSINGARVVTLIDEKYKNATSVKIAPIVESGSSEKLCSASREIAFVDCAD